MRHVAGDIRGGWGEVESRTLGGGSRGWAWVHKLTRRVDAIRRRIISHHVE